MNIHLRAVSHGRGIAQGPQPIVSCQGEWSGVQRFPKNGNLKGDKENYPQIIFAWTDDQNDLATVQHLKRLGVDGVIYDR